MVDNGVVTGCACGVLLHSDMMLSLAILLETWNTHLNTWSANNIHSLWSDFHASFIGLWDRKLQCFSGSSHHLGNKQQHWACSVINYHLEFKCLSALNWLRIFCGMYLTLFTTMLHFICILRCSLEIFFYHHVVTSGCTHRDYFLWKKSHVTHELPLCDWSDALHVNVQD